MRRYLFYTFGVMKSSPYPLFYMRYSLFAILYPTGIAGEVMTMLAGLPDLKVCDVRSMFLSFVFGRGLLHTGDEKRKKKLPWGRELRRVLLFSATIKGQPISVPHACEPRCFGEDL